MPEDDLDKEIAVSAELLPNGLKAGAKSRTLAAVDRLGGNLVELLNVRIEEWTSRRRAIIKGKAALIEAAVSKAISDSDDDATILGGVFVASFKDMMRKQENKDGVIIAALEELRDGRLESDAESDIQEPISEDFLSRFETFAEGASTEELRARWGRVLAAEIRKPGTFSRKVLRIVDEIDASTAALFEDVCKYRIGSYLPLCILRELTYPDRLSLEGAGLLEDDQGLVTKPAIARSPEDAPEAWVIILENYAFEVEKKGLQAKKTFAARKEPIILEGDGVAMPVSILTPSGRAIASILPDRQDDAARLVSDELAKVANSHMVRELVPGTATYRFRYRRGGD